MITRLDMTPAEFDRRRDRLRSRWAQLLEALKADPVGAVESICLRGEENTGAARNRARQSIYAITRHHGIRIHFCSTPLALLVLKCGDHDSPNDSCPICHPSPALTHAADFQP
jgi:hypothetical protein